MSGTSEKNTTKLMVNRDGTRQAFFVYRGTGGCMARGTARSAYAQIATELETRNMEIFHERVFGELTGYDDVMAERRAALEAKKIDADTPVTYIQGLPPCGAGLAGVIVHAVSVADSHCAVRTIVDQGRPRGRCYTVQGTTYLMLQEVGGATEHKVDRSLQAGTAIDQIGRILSENGATFHHVVRTWFYLSHILEWYGEFNKVRNERYASFGILSGSEPLNPTLPASTGISGENRSGAVCAVDVMAIVPANDNRPAITQLSNPGQKDAFRYGSAFSRGALIHHPPRALIELSGTAAIDESGASLYPDDIRAQIGCTFDKIETLLDQHGAKLTDIGAATVFIKRPEFADVFWQMVRDRGLGAFPGVCVVADICREDLLFEIDAEVQFCPSGN